MATPAKTKCDVCGGISLNSEMQARQHFTGKSHIKNLRKKGLRVPPDMSAATAPKKRPMPSSSTMPTVTPLLPPHIQLEMEKKSRWGPAMDPVAQAVVDNALGKLPKKKKLEIPCAVCELIFNSESQATQHFQGQKHIRRMKTIQDMRKTLQGDESGSNSDTVNRTVRPGGSNFSCHFCNIGFETLQMFEMHRESASHKQAVEAKAASQAKKSEELPGQQTKFYCRVCDVSFRKPGELNQHLSSLTHQDRAAGRVTAKPDDVPPGTTDISLPAYTDTAEPGVPPPPPPPPPPTENSEFTPMWT